MMKRLLSILILLALLVSVAAGCSKQKTDDTGTTAAKTDTITQAVTTEESKAIEGKVNVFFSEVTTWPGFMPAMEEFKKDNPGIDVDFSSVKNDQYMSTLQTRTAANDVPDVFLLYYGIPYYVNFINKGLLMDITDEKFMDRLTDTNKELMKVNGRIYGVPNNVQVIGTLYNKDIYKELNLSIPKTWEEFLSNCETIKKAGKTPIALGIKDAFVVQMLPYTLWPSLLYADKQDFEQQRIDGKVKYNSLEWKKALELTFDVFNKGYTNTGALGVSYDQSLEMFATGKAVMLHMGDWCVDSLQKINPELNMGFFLTPAPAGIETAAPGQPNGIFVIGKNAQSPEAAKKYVEGMATDPKYYYQWNKSSLQSLKDAPASTNPVYQEFADAYSKATKTYGFVASNWINSSLQDVYMRAMQDVYAGQKTVDQLAEELDAQFEKILPEYQKGLEK